MKLVQVFLSRRNLLTLLSKLDRQASGEATLCTIRKHDMEHPVYPQSHATIQVTAVEDEAYYIDRNAGVVMPQDDPCNKAP